MENNNQIGKSQDFNKPLAFYSYLNINYTNRTLRLNMNFMHNTKATRVAKFTIIIEITLCSFV